MDRVDIVDVLRGLSDEIRSRIHTSLPAKVQAVNASEGTVDVQPVISLEVNGEKVDYPTFPGVPVVWPQGGSSYIAAPVEVGDYCLLVIAERCIDGWWAGTDNQPALDSRLHDYSDAFALCGVRRGGEGVPIPDEMTLRGTVRLGTVAPSDFVALAGKVGTELNNAGADIETVKNAISVALGTIDTALGTTLKLTFDASTTAVPWTPADVKSAYVEAD